MFKKSLVAAVAALTIAASMASPAQALSKRGAVALGLGLGTIAAIGIASAHDRNRYYEPEEYYNGGDYYDSGDYYNGGGYYVTNSRYRYRSEHRSYRSWARKCANRWGWQTRRWDRCMARHGF